MKSRESCKLIAKNTFYESFKRIAFAFCAVLFAVVSPTFADDSGTIVYPNGEPLQTRHQSGLPLGYTELEYIESTGIVSGLYTGVQWKDVSKIEILYQIISRASIGNIVLASLSTEPSGVVTGVEFPYIAYTNSGTGPTFSSINGTASPNYSATELTGGGLKGITYTFAANSIAKYVWFGSWQDGAYTPTYQCGCVKIYDTNDEIIRNYVPAKRNSDNVVGMYDTVSGQFFTNAGTGTFTAGPEVVPQIQIATTKYNEDAFAGLVTTLNEAITKVTNIVNDTVSQANSIGELAETKQDRPADGDCPAGRKCLLVTGTDGKPHWYLIQE